MTEEEWLAIKNKDKSYDGLFFYALKTTKTVCRPSCTARICNPKNVIIFKTVEDAVAQGFRPCFRCRPNQLEWEGAKKELAEAAKNFIENHYVEKFSLSKIASSLFINEHYLVRAFKDSTGQTLLQYHNYYRCMEAQRLLTQMELSISYISSSVGYSTPSHFSRTFKKMFGCTPTEFRNNYIDSLKKK